MLSKLNAPLFVNLSNIKCKLFYVMGSRYSRVEFKNIKVRFSIVTSLSLLINTIMIIWNLNIKYTYRLSA